MTTITAERAFAMDVSRGQTLTGRVLVGLVALFLAVDGAARMAGFAPYIEGTVRYGFEAELAPWLGGLLLVATLLYVLPRTALIGALLITAYLGGATATHVSFGEPWFFPVIMGVVAWTGLVLKDGTVRALVFATLRGADGGQRSGR